MKCYLQLIGVASGDANTSIQLFFDEQRYIFNVGDGTQRFCAEHKVRLAKADTIFLTKLHPDAVGGLPGMLMTVSDAGKDKISICGPHGLNGYFYGTRAFFYRSSFTVALHEFDHYESEPFSDGNITIWPVILDPLREGKTTEEPCDDFWIEGVLIQDTLPRKRRHDEITSSNPKEESEKKISIAEVNDKDVKEEPEVKEQLPLGKSLFNQLERFSACEVSPNTTLCYIGKICDIPGKFNAKRAKELGVPPGPLFGKLVKGETIVVDGVEIHPDQCVAPATPGPVFIIVDCPSTAHMQVLLQSDSFRNHFADGDYPALVIIHLAPLNIFSCGQYQDWMDKFSRNTQHILSNEEVCSNTVANLASISNQIKLNSFSSEIFPLPFDTISSVTHPPLKGSAITAMPLFKYHLAPANMIGVDGSECFAKPKISDVLSSLSSNEECREVQTGFSDWHSSWIKERKQEEDGDAMFAFLGTGAALPSKYRNVSSILVKTDNKPSYILLDAGEGTFQQLCALYGVGEANSILMNTKLVFISHIHADHHLGLLKVLVRRQELVRDFLLTIGPIYVIGPSYLGRWLYEYGKYVEKLDYLFVPSQTHDNPLRRTLHTCLNLLQLNLVEVHHCPQAYGIVITMSNKYKFAYSGDTRPCEELIQVGQKCNVLIHEATFEDELESEAKYKMHCTTKEAIETAEKMNADYVILTHFSQRYPKLPVISNQPNTDLRVLVASDLMTVTPSNIEIGSNFLPVLEAVWKEAKEIGDGEA